MGLKENLLSIAAMAMLMDGTTNTHTLRPKRRYRYEKSKKDRNKDLANVNSFLMGGYNGAQRIKIAKRRRANKLGGITKRVNRR